MKFGTIIGREDVTYDLTTKYSSYSSNVILSLLYMTSHEQLAVPNTLTLSTNSSDS